MKCGPVASLLASMALVLTPVSLNAQSKDDKEPPGMKVGKKAPEFKLKAQDGKEVALKELLKKNKVALVFFRSTRW